MEEGREIAQPEELEQAYRAHREAIWTAPPPLDWEKLYRYVRTLPEERPQAPLPTEEDIAHVIRRAPDTAPGMNGCLLYPTHHADELTR